MDTMEAGGIGSIVMNSTRCWRSGRKLSTTHRESQPRVAGWSYAIGEDVGLTCRWTSILKPGKGADYISTRTQRIGEAEVERLLKIGTTRYPAA